MPRQRKSKKLHVVQGTFRKHRHEDREELELPPGIPDKPEFLSECGAKEWDRITPIMLDMGTLTKLDSAALATYCELYAEFQSTRSCPSAFPASKFAALRLSFSDLGLSPVARTKIPGLKKEPERNNPFARPL